MDRLAFLRFQTKVWLFFVLLVGIAWLTLWFKMPKTPEQARIYHQKQAIVANKLPIKIDKMTELFQEVAPVKFDTVVRDLRSYPPEFKDKSYFEKHSKKWAVKLMDVSEHKLIVDYLDMRPDRDKFAYFRYSDVNRKSRYVLVYGVFSSSVEAMGNAKAINFGQTIFGVPEEYQRFVDMIDNYERTSIGAQDKDLYREVKLAPTEREIPVVPPTPKPAIPKPPKPKEKKDKPTAANTVSLDEPVKKKPKKEPSELEKFEEHKRRAEAAARAKADETSTGSNNNGDGQ